MATAADQTPKPEEDTEAEMESTMDEVSFEDGKKRKISNFLLEDGNDNKILRLVNFPAQEYLTVVGDIRDYVESENFSRRKEEGFKRLEFMEIEPERCRIRLTEEERKERERLSRLKYASKPETIRKRKELMSTPEYVEKRKAMMKDPKIIKQKAISQKARRIMLKEIKDKDRKSYEEMRQRAKKLVEQLEKQTEK